MKIRLAILLLCLWLQYADSAELMEKVDSVTYLEPGSIVDYKPMTFKRGILQRDLRTYCYRGTSKSISRFFESVELLFDIEGDDYTQYEGATPAEVREHYEEQKSLFSMSLFSQKRTRLQLSPFLQQCIGIESGQPYRVILQKQNVDIWRLIQLTVGILVFVYAATLSNNAVFYYITGVTLGICSSFMLLIWLSSKLVPRRSMMYGMLIGGWTIGIYFIQMIWENLQVIIVTYRAYVFWYLVTTGLVSFFFCYRWGPPKNQRSKNIIKWILQLMSLALVYLSSHFDEASVAIMIITITSYYFPRSIFTKMRGWYLKRFPPKRRLLTDAEYYEQGVRETTKALEELREYARSPDCKQWKVMAQLSDPLRFAAFVEGASHLRDEEILRFENTNYDDGIDIADDSSEEEFVDNTARSNPTSTPITYRQLRAEQTLPNRDSPLSPPRSFRDKLSHTSSASLHRLRESYSYGLGNKNPTSKRTFELQDSSDGE